MGIILRAALLAAAGAAICSAPGAAAPAHKPAAACATSASDRPWLDPALSPECRADALIARLATTDQKLAALAGGGLKPFGIVDSRGSDGPAGPTQTPGALSLPNGLALASSFDPDLAKAYGGLVGRQFRAAGRQQMLGPTLDITRTWRAGRTPEAYGEDPFLTGQMAAPFVKAVQAEGVAVTLKHFAVYAQEQGRTGDLPFGTQPAVDNIVSERAIREIYLPGFRAAVQDGGALNVMCAFPRINGAYACENKHLLGILKGEWGMRGTVSPDFPDAQRSVIDAINAGLDNGSFGLPGGFGGGPPPPPAPPAGAPAGAHPPGPPPGMNMGAALGVGRTPGGVSLQTAVQQGRVSDARLDDMLRRRLVSMFAVGAGVDAPTPTGTFADDASKAIALRTAEAGAVLLRNEKGILPFGPSVHSIAVIGAQAGSSAQVSTPGSAHIDASRLIPALEAIKARGLTVTYAKGDPGLNALPVVGDDVLRTPDGHPGLRAVYYPNPSLRFSGSSFADRVESAVNVPGPLQIEGAPPNNGWSAVWTGSLTPRTSGLHKFTIAGSGSGRLFIDGKLAARFDRVDFGSVSYATASLQAGHAVSVRIEYTPRESAPIPGMPLLGTTMGTLMKFGWEEPDDKIAQAVDAARHADVAVVFAANRYGEGADRPTLGLPSDQDALIEAVAAANPHTVVVLSTAGPVSMPWAAKVQAIVEMWYPGDMFGLAASQLLFGDAAPQGRLPLTFPRDETQGPAIATRNYPGLTDANGALDKAFFDEGLLVGYRWFDAKGQAPLYPFGYGLTYAPMTLEAIHIAAHGDKARVTARVWNKGRRADVDVVQVYVGFPDGGGEPPKRLAGFQRIEVKAGDRGHVDIALPRSAFELWDAKANKWQSPHGPFKIMVGRSSRDIIATQIITR